MQNAEGSSFVAQKVVAQMAALAEAYRAAHPFPHVVIDDFLPLDLIDRVHDEARRAAPNVNSSNDLTQSLKSAVTDWAAFGPEVLRTISFFQSGAFISIVEGITGLRGLFADPHLEGGGVHLIRRGGFLKMHTDFNWHPMLKAHRRVNILLYLNKDWKPEFGGELTLTKLGGGEVRHIAPIYNRLVIFNTNDYTLHGHPDTLMFPDDYPRASIALYYYGVDKPSAEKWRLNTSTTRYLPRTSGDIVWTRGSWRAALGYLVRRFTRF